jgi:glycine/D-amino acid oxidase-like deaminating enzyme
MPPSRYPDRTLSCRWREAAVRSFAGCISFYNIPSRFNLMSLQYKELPKDKLPPGVVQGFTFSTVSMDTPRYLNYLLSRFIGTGGTIVRGAVQHINQVLEGGPHIFTSAGKHATSPDAVIVCTGIGTRFLGGVEDRDVHPIRGQTVLIRAPWIRFGKTTTSENGELTYIIPRRSGDVRWCFAPSADIERLYLNYRSFLAEQGTRTIGKWPT